MTKVTLLLCALGLAAAGCGERESQSTGALADLVVMVDADGAGPLGAKVLHVRCDSGEEGAACAELTRLSAADFEPKRAEVACTDIFGGPQTARVTGTLRGQRIAERFSRTNGCEIARWDTVAPLLRLAR